ncbi:element excision factor XisH family protein [Nostoc sp. TCL240-02]|uniref:element excision factor XisH family protein n=1 Tax=Nostoc sp. TCL240-02 TaxID=2572090 RepID=UPI00157FA572|nr:element excision factor XisH family protein [Nostoc sp. TCL240-02]QKQ73457.1 fatty-acid synthase [Nostoc sp. TCL240-02]
MPVRDCYHENLKNALIKDGWNVTDDPFHLKWGKKDLYVDLAAEKLLTAEKGTEKIAVEIKTFSGDSEVADLEQAIGQYFTYLAVMSRNYQDRVLYIAVHEDVFTDIFEEEPLGKLILEDYKIPLIVFNPKREVIVRWVIWSNTGN